MDKEEIRKKIEKGDTKGLKKLVVEEVNRECKKARKLALKRESAMKRYYRFPNKDNLNWGNYQKCLNRPCINTLVQGRKYNVFFDGISLVLTTESLGDLIINAVQRNQYPKFEHLFNISNCKQIKQKVDIEKVLLEAKKQGYRYKKSEIGIGTEYKYVFKFKGSYYKMGLLDKAFNIINDGNLAEVVYLENEDTPLHISTSIGKMLLMPCKPTHIGLTEKIVIDADYV